MTILDAYDFDYPKLIDRDLTRSLSVARRKTGRAELDHRAGQATGGRERIRSAEAP